MEIISFCDSPDNANTYLLLRDGTALIIDPANDVRIMNKYLNNIKILGVFLTHGHYDHFKALPDLLKLDNNLTVYLNKRALQKLADKELSCAIYFNSNLEIKLNNYQEVVDNQIINLGNFTIKCLSLPGHTSCSMGYIIDNNFFVGDAIFSDGIGRYDLATASYVSTLNSLKRIKSLNQDLHVYSGHGEDFILKNSSYKNYLN